MSSTSASDWWKSEINWDAPAGALLERFFESLPRARRFRFTLYGSAPLQLTLDRTWLSADVDLFSNDDEDLVEWVRRAGLAKDQSGFYLEPGFALSFRTSPRWPGTSQNCRSDECSGHRSASLGHSHRQARSPGSERP